MTDPNCTIYRVSCFCQALYADSKLTSAVVGRILHLIEFFNGLNAHSLKEQDEEGRLATI
jgi:hypothetical protein